MGELDIIKEEIIHTIKDITDYELLDFVHKLLAHSVEHT